MAAKTPRIAIVHDWLVGGGAEQVVLQLHHLYPDAPIYTSYCSPEWRKKLDSKVVTGYLQRWPFSHLRKFVVPLRQHWFSHLDLSGYEVVISSSGNGEAKGVRVQDGTTHICYCHSPTHFYWRHYDEYLAHPGFGVFDPVARLGLKLLVGPLRRWDLKASRRPDYYIANSNHIKDDIKKYYDRDAVVIHPPVDVERFAAAPRTNQRAGFVTLGRQKPYKRIDLIVQACTQLGVPLTVLGSGPDHSRLKRMAGASVRFIKKPSSEEVVRELAAAEGFIFAAHEDFGIAPVEAMATGTPVIALKAGGALDYVEPGKTGMFFGEQTVDSLMRAVQKFKPSDYKPNDISRAAQAFSASSFRAKIEKFVQKVCE